MKKLLSLAAGIALVSFAGIANAADGQKAADQPTTLTVAQMDEVTAGRLGGTRSTSARVVNLGAYSLVFDGRTWSVVWK